MDRETVITHLQIIHTWAEFARERDVQFFTPKHLEDIAEWTDNALALLKEKEAKTGHWNGPECSHCHAILERKWRFEYCPYCGAKMERQP